MENKIKNLKYLEEFELVDNSKQEIYNDKETQNKNKGKVENTGNRTYTEKNVYIEPVFKSATSIEYNVYYYDENNELQHMGTVKSDKQIVLTAKYKERKRLEVDGKEFDFDSQKLEVDVQKMIEKQNLKDEMNKRKNEKSIEDEDRTLEKQQQEKDGEEKNIDNKDEKDQDKKTTEQNSMINDNDLKEQGYNISRYTRITDQHIIDNMIAENYDPRSMIVAEVDGQIKFLAKERGTKQIKELDTLNIDNSMEEVNEFENNVERTRGAGTKVRLPNCPGVEFNVNKNKMGQLEVGVIGDIDEQGNREVLSIGSPVHPTEQEYKRAESEKFEKYGYGPIDTQILTKDEVDARLAEEVESVRDEVGQEIETMAKNPTLKELEEKIQKERDRQQKVEEKQAEDVEERDEEEEEYEKVPWDRHPHP